MKLLTKIFAVILFFIFTSNGFAFSKKKPPVRPAPPPVTQPLPPPPPVVIPPAEDTPEPLPDPKPDVPPPSSELSCIVLDAGHGGHDPGAGNATYNVKEKDVALQFVMRLKKLFQESQLPVYFTRESDVFIPLSERVDIANASECEYFVAIHLNSFNTKAEGFETYYGRESSRAFANEFHFGWAPWMNSPDRGVKKANFAVIRALEENRIMTEEEIEMISHFNIFDKQAAAHLKSILVELYFIDNDREIERYLDELRIINGVFESLKNIIKK